MEGRKIRKGKSDEMVNAIEAIYNGDLNLSLKGPKRNSAYRKKLAEIDEMERTIEANCGKDIVRKLEETAIDLEEIVAKDHFVMGFMWGARLMLAIFDDEPDTFGYQEE